MNNWKGFCMKRLWRNQGPNPIICLEWMRKIRKSLTRNLGNR
jgi:hypothetical protein